MSRRFTAVTILFVIWCFGLPIEAARAQPPLPSTGQSTLTSSSTGVRFKASGEQDTFCLYGGPNNPDAGKFQVGAIPGVLGHAPHAILEDEWFGVDLSAPTPFWQVSSFCAENLDGSGGAGNGPGNLAWWAGRTAEQEPGWTTAPGYGNNWLAQLEWRATVADPSVGQTVALSFAFHHDLENGYDYFVVEYDSATTNQQVYSISGGNDPFAAPGVQYPLDVSPQPIVYAPFGYAGALGDEIVLRLVVRTDGGHSDEDGLFPTQCSAAIVDDIVVTYTDGVEPVIVDVTDVDTSSSWRVVTGPFRGDFSDIHFGFADLDPCRENRTPMAGFLDYGQCPKNAANNGGEPPCLSTGGSLSSQWNYGVPGGWVVNYTGGVWGVITGLDDGNEIWSPPIAWDLPGTEDDSADVAGAVLGFDVWRHMPLLNGIFYQWHVRASADNGATWDPFVDRNYVYFGTRPEWYRFDATVSDLVTVSGQAPTHVQIALAQRDLAALFAFPGNDATPSPMFDNVVLKKYRVGGPVISRRDVDVFMDGFPQSGESDFTTLAGRQNADVRLDTRDVNTNLVNVPGDSMIVTVTSVIAGADVTSVELEWILDKNPWFDDARVMPAGTTVITGGALYGWDQWHGILPARQSQIWPPEPDEYFFDLPDQDFFVPGDRMRYVIRATDSQGRVTTLPRDIAGFATGLGPTPYDPRFAVNALPSFFDDGFGAEQPRILIVDDSGFESTWNVSFYAAGLSGHPFDNSFFDWYRVAGATSALGNGIGSAGAHGATAAQLSGYDTIFYLSGDLDVGLSDGSDTSTNDKSDDLGVLTSWFQQDESRYIAHFGDDVMSATLAQAPGPGTPYVQGILGVQVFEVSVTDQIDGQTAPRVLPYPGPFGFDVDYVAYGGCPGLNTFDNIGPAAGAWAAHRFLDHQGGMYPGPERSASVAYDRVDGPGNVKRSIVFPYGLASIRDPSEPNPNPATARGDLFKEVLMNYFGHVRIIEFPVDTDPVVLPLSEVRVYPNPANPATRITFRLGQRSKVLARVYDLRGMRVATLFDGFMDAGNQELAWKGLDHRGVEVSSGAYLVRIESEGRTEITKVALIK